MGLFSSGDNDSADRANALVEQQMAENEIQIEQKRRDLVQTRLQVIKSQGAQNWSGAPTNTGLQPVRSKVGMNEPLGMLGKAVSDAMRGSQAIKDFTGKQ
jgi:hypothetical protein